MDLMDCYWAVWRTSRRSLVTLRNILEWEISIVQRSEDETEGSLTTGLFLLIWVCLRLHYIIYLDCVYYYITLHFKLWLCLVVYYKLNIDYVYCYITFYLFTWFTATLPYMPVADRSLRNVNLFCDKQETNLLSATFTVHWTV